MNNNDSAAVDAFSFRQFVSAVNRAPAPAFITNIVALQLIAFFVRPQHELPILGTVGLPTLLSALSLAAWIYARKTGWGRELLCCSLLLFQGLGLVLVATNTRLAFDGVRALSILFFTLCFPIALLYYTRRLTERLWLIMAALGLYLGVYSLTHVGRGPGDFLGDENDLCLVLVMLLPFTIGSYFFSHSFFRRSFCVIAALVAIAGMVATFSRGGFVGMLAMFVVLWWRSRQRIKALALSSLVAMVMVALVPSSYWEDMSSIKQTNEGTARARRETWSYSIQIFLRPENVLAGAGMRNTPVLLGDFKLSTGRNLWGRAAHSMYFELLPDLGTIGACLFFSAVFASFRNRIKNRRMIGFLLKRLNSRPPSLDVNALRSELNLAFRLSGLLDASMAGVLASAAFISVLYYPPIWLLLGIGVALATYTRRVVTLADDMLNGAARA